MRRNDGTVGPLDCAAKRAPGTVPVPDVREVPEDQDTARHDLDLTSRKWLDGWFEARVTYALRRMGILRPGEIADADLMELGVSIMNELLGAPLTIELMGALGEALDPKV